LLALDQGSGPTVPADVSAADGLCGGLAKACAEQGSNSHYKMAYFIGKAL
jgi:hypothetical protein